MHHLHQLQYNHKHWTCYQLVTTMLQVSCTNTSKILFAALRYGSIPGYDKKTSVAKKIRRKQLFKEHNSSENVDALSRWRQWRPICRQHHRRCPGDARTNDISPMLAMLHRNCWLCWLWVSARHLLCVDEEKKVRTEQLAASDKTGECRCFATEYVLW